MKTMTPYNIEESQKAPEIWGLFLLKKDKKREEPEFSSVEVVQAGG